MHYHSVSEITLPWNVWVSGQKFHIKHLAPCCIFLNEEFHRLTSCSSSWNFLRGLVYSYNTSRFWLYLLYDIQVSLVFLSSLQIYPLEVYTCLCTFLLIRIIWGSCAITLCPQLWLKVHNKKQLLWGLFCKNGIEKNIHYTTHYLMYKALEAYIPLRV